MKREQSLPYRPRAIHPVGFCGGWRARILSFFASREGGQATRAIDGQPASQCDGMDRQKADLLCDEVTATYEGLQYGFSISGEYCRRKSG